MVDDDYEKAMLELRIKQALETMKTDPENWVANLEQLGFQWFDDEDDHEFEEEIAARPENPRQESLVKFFEGSVDLSDQVLQSFLDEKDSRRPNYALIRRYFRQGNENLKKLLMFGLEKYPTDIGLLNDLAFFNEFRNILGDLIRFYLKACEEEKDMARFEELAMDFYANTGSFGFDALIELERHFGLDSDKGKVIQKIKHDMDSQPEVITF
jgi:hypothetical protein